MGEPPNIVKAAPEQLRHASEEETFTISEWIEGIVDTRKRLEQEPKRGYIDLTDQDIPDFQQRPQGELREEPRQPARRLHGKTEKQKVEFKEKMNDYWTYEAPQGLLVRWHPRTRSQLFRPEEAEPDCPLPITSINSYRRTIIQNEDGEVIREIVDEWNEMDEQSLSTPLPEQWTGRTEFTVRTAEGQVHVPRDRKEHPVFDEDRELKRARVHESRESEQSDKGNETKDEEEHRYPDMEIDTEENPRGEVREREGADDEEDQDQPHKRLRTEMIEVYNLTLARMMASKTKKEIQLKQLGGERKQAFLRAIKKEIQNNLDSGAYEFLNPTESEEVRRNKFEKLIQSRYVLTAKTIEPDDVAKAQQDQILLPAEGDQEEPQKAKARHVMKGFSEQDAEGLEAATPQVGRESVLFTLQILSSFGWIPGYLDFTQAFHSGDKISREIYATQPPEGVPGYQPRQVLRLLKTCYGLLDGPYAWFQHLRRVLTQQLGYEESSADPCLYFLRGAQGELQGIISVATDDLLHGGGELHWQKMEWLNKNYRMGKFSRGDGRFVGKDIKYHPDGRILVHQPAYAQKILPIPLTKERKAQKLDECTEAEITQLRGLLGALSWLSKETRPDLSGRTALLQQTMPRPRIQEIIEANILAKEAKEFADLGVTLHPIPVEHLRLGTATDASWGNVELPGGEVQEDYWEEQTDHWVRVHRTPRRLTFHPGGAPGGPNMYQLEPGRTTLVGGERLEDSWTGRDEIYNMECGQVGRSSRSVEVIQRRSRRSMRSFFKINVWRVKDGSSLSSMMEGWRLKRRRTRYQWSIGEAIASSDVR